MKKLLTSVVLALSLLTLPVVSTGCRTQLSAQQIALKSLESTWQAVHAARQVYAEAYQAGLVDAETHARALRADAQFRAAFDAALDSAGLDWSEATPANVAIAAGSLLEIIRIATTKD